MSAKAKILKNLEGRVHPINEWLTTKGLTIAEGSVALRELVREGLVKVSEHRLPDTDAKVSMYRRTYHDALEPKLAVDNSEGVS